jgi:hypothetical protein
VVTEICSCLIFRNQRLRMGKCWCGYMTVGGKRMYVVLTSHRIAARGETPVLPVYGDE